MAVLITLLSVLLGLAVLTRLFPYAFRLLGRTIGNSIRSKTLHRREILLTRAVAEETDQKSTTTKPTASSASLDSDWEKVSSNGTQTPKSSPTTTSSDSSYSGVIAFFHPFCNAGGGGERVLFAAILATQQRYPNALCVVYTGDHDASRDQILANARNRFNIHLQPSRVVFLYLTTREWVLASKWPRFTLLGQSIGSLILGWDAFTLLAPDIMIDTMGYAFVLALSKWLFPSVPTAAYVHYPTISTDMLQSLNSTDGSQGLNAGSGKGFRGLAKQFYWQKFASLYSWVGGSVDIVMTNSSWTQSHISTLWKPSRASQQPSPRPITVVYPPCAVAELQEKIPVTLENEKDRQPHILYIAQFRPEKMHTTIIDAFHTFLREHHSSTPPSSRPRLILVGSVRDDHDEKRVYKLRLQAQEVKDSVDFVVNAKWPQILEFLKSSKVGVNGMWNEHFGIGVVEYQAAGLVAVVNDSGGPKADIVVEVDGGRTGFHATTPKEFADGFAQALALKDEEAYAMRCRARKSSWRFSEEVFIEAWTKELVGLVHLTNEDGQRKDI
ncbi:putative secreted alpha-1,2-mannosyltransferase [Zymoseptoria tritici IPO323]|uniref:GDP-Man:Man(3)GlcNAc(2)-PP-Dol alpha-1,2-mannosyltransferase n=1 Tax=Zymoseptoria tritici (strain CBS 115943 / IPO323) TaxID=336722 RepID=F9XNK7_ZYMTI|nr:putative secreted alpha-1,2-mannosyltransferase [Zymoseptoria tritici IPO323]EGP82888.1 putative secreted alpha-1,2-mannosyltransferase [Zymoseptoria tritici IPO323]